MIYPSPHFGPNISTSKLKIRLHAPPGGSGTGRQISELEARLAYRVQRNCLKKTKKEKREKGKKIKDSIIEIQLVTIWL